MADEQKDLIPEINENSGTKKSNSKWCGMPPRTAAAAAFGFTYVTTQIGSIFLGPVAHQHITNTPPLNTTDFGCPPAPNSTDIDGTAAAETAKCLFNAAIALSTAMGGAGGLLGGIAVLGIAVVIVKLCNCAKESDYCQNNIYKGIN